MSVSVCVCVLGVAPVTMFRTGLMRAEKAGTSGCRCSHIGCQMTRPLANRKVRSDSCRKCHTLSEVKPSEVKPSEVKPSEVEPSEVEPSEVKPSEVKRPHLDLV